MWLDFALRWVLARPCSWKRGRAKRYLRGSDRILEVAVAPWLSFGLARVTHGWFYRVVEELKAKFETLLLVIQRVIADQKTAGLIHPETVSMCRFKALSYEQTETGVKVGPYQTQEFTEEGWTRAKFKVVDILTKCPDYENFVESAHQIAGRDMTHLCRHAVSVLVGKNLHEEDYNASELLAQFVQLLNDEPVSVRCEVDVYGVAVQGTKNVSFSVDGQHYTFRQWEITDFEQPFEPRPVAMGIFHTQQLPPGCILRVEIKAIPRNEIQMQIARQLTLLRLFRVCTVKFSREVFELENLFAFPFGIANRLELLWHGPDPICLTAGSADRLAKFWRTVSPKLPTGLHDYGPKQATPVFIAYDRYCDSLFNQHPVERRIAFAIMGLEAIYLGENEVAELMYRLEFRVSKFLSKLGFHVSDARRILREGYKIRNKHVHGGHLSEDKKEKLRAENTPVDAIAQALLNHLRLSILHLIVSQHSKKDLLNLLEDSFLDRAKDDELEALLAPEKEFV